MSNYTNTLFIGKVLIRYNSIDSTNLEAQKLLAERNIIEGTTIIASNQTAGIGQRGNTWVSEEGSNLLCSIILKPQFLKPSQHFYLNIFSSLAICDLLQALGIKNYRVKWPNDIYIEDKKVAGMLIQNAISQSTIQHSILGIGLNVNQRQFSESLFNPTSLANVLNTPLHLEKLSTMLFSFVEKRYLQLKSERFSILKLDYEELLFRNKQDAYYIIDNKKQLGRIQGVDAQGKLMIKLNSTPRSFDLQEIKFVL